MGEHLRRIHAGSGDLDKGPLEPGKTLRLHLQDGLPDARIAARREPPAGLVEPDRPDVAAPAHGPGDFRQGDVAVRKLQLLQVAQGPPGLRMTGEVLEEAPEVAGRRARASRGCVAQLVAALGRDADGREEVLRHEPARRRAQAEQGGCGETGFQAPGAKHGAALAVGKIHVPELETQGARGCEPGDLHRPDARPPAGRRRLEPALGDRTERPGGDVALRQPPCGESREQHEAEHDADQGRRDMSDGWPQQAGNPLAQ